MATATMSVKGQTTIPRSIREHLGVKPGDRVDFIVQHDGSVLLLPATIHVAELRGILPKPPRAVSLEAMDDAIERGARRR